MSHAPIKDLKDAAIIAAHAAGTVLNQHFGKPLKIQEKKGAGLVSNADLEAEQAIVQILSRAFPDFGFLTEEAAPTPANGPGRWIIDPLDGTNNYIHGFPMFCVSIAAEWNGEVQVGVIYHPILKEMHVAVKGQGMTLNGTKMQVSKTKLLGDALLTTGFTYHTDSWLRSELHTIEQLSAKSRAIRRPGSAALDLAYTARGVFDGFWEQRLHAWDVAAGILMVQEAGGTVSDFDGNAVKLDSPQLLASNGTIHPILLEIIRKNRENSGESST